MEMEIEMEIVAVTINAYPTLHYSIDPRHRNLLFFFWCPGAFFGIFYQLSSTRLQRLPNNVWVC